MKLLFTFILLSSICFGQNKKDQIETLNKSIDSLEKVLENERIVNSKITHEQSNSLTKVKSSISVINLNISDIQKENTTVKKLLDQKEDSINIINEQIESQRSEIISKSRELKEIEDSIGLKLNENNDGSQLIYNNSQFLDFNQIRLVYFNYESIEQMETGYIYCLNFCKRNFKLFKQEESI